MCSVSPSHSTASVHYRALSRLGVLLLLVLIVLSTVVVRQRSLPVASVFDETLEPGDILFVDIYHGWSHGGYWDHAALYLEDPYPGVMEATFNAGVAYTPLPAFLERDLPAKVSVRRLKDIPNRDEIIREAIDYALAQLEKPFDYTATATLPLKISRENLHCSEVVWRAYKTAGIELDSNNGPLVYPDDMYFSPKLGPP